MSRAYIQQLAENICRYRKIANLSHESFAMLVGVSTETVRAWEDASRMPGIDQLPVVARVFGVSIDWLYGLRKNVHPNPQMDLPWDDDNNLRAVIYKGRRLIQRFDQSIREFSFTYMGEALNVESWCTINCGVPGYSSGTMGIKGNATAGFDINCANIAGNASAGRDINCKNIVNNATAGRDISCSGVGGSFKAGRNLEKISL